MRAAMAAALLRARARSRALSSSSMAPPLKSSEALTKEELSQIHALVPRLIDSGHLDDAVRLIDAALLADPSSQSSLPLPLIADSLSDHSDLTPTMSLLTAVRYNPSRPSPLALVSLLIASFLRRRRLKEAVKVFFWLCRSDSPCRPDRDVYATAIEGFCRHGKTLEGLRAMREMVRDGVVPEREMKEAVWRGLLQEARVDEAQELNAALADVREEGDVLDAVALVLDRIIKDWQE
ncbi:Pentatricopeptide repeat-containing protein [Dioscorea alata]|uniref:Pentatricopeptide repeat-containing protein n=1 Tax=Dioscorea alata TaxID=55571 RepID=A0ACB7U2M5_DIOAL|nr:Pentatricopeptide repeat-containing protein [Dioscorea alata]